MDIYIKQSGFLRILSISLFSYSIIHAAWLILIKENIIYWRIIYWTMVIIGVIVSLGIFCLSFWSYQINDIGIKIKSNLTKNEKIYEWNDFNYAYYDVDYRGGTTLIVSFKELDYREKQKIKHQIYIDPLFLDDAIKLRIDPNSENGRLIQNFIKKQYGVSLNTFHRV